MTNTTKTKLRFVKLMKRWFADTYWLEDLDVLDTEMVAGADEMLEYLSKGKNQVTLNLSTSKTSEVPYEYIKLSKINPTDEYGQSYIADVINEVNSGESIVTKSIRVWICPVTEMVFGNYPDTIYIW